MKSLAAVLSPATGSASFFSGHTLNTVLAAFRIARERKALADLDPRMLEDIGVTEAQAQRESGRAFWDLPRRR